MIYLRSGVTDILYDLKSEKSFVHCRSVQNFCSSLMKSDPVSEASYDRILQIQDIVASFEDDILKVSIIFDDLSIFTARSYKISILFDDCDVNMNWQQLYNLVDKYFDNREIMQMMYRAKKLSELSDVVDRLCLMSI